MGTRDVVVAEIVRERAGPRQTAAVGVGICPFREQRANEAFGLTVRARVYGRVRRWRTPCVASMTRVTGMPRSAK